MADDFIVYNPGASSVYLFDGLGIEVPAGEEVNLLSSHDIEVLQADAELIDALTVSLTLQRRVGGRTLSPADPDIMAGPVGQVQIAAVGPFRITISSLGQTSLPLPSAFVDESAIVLTVNGVEAEKDLEWSVASPTELTWLDLEYLLAPSDRVAVKYTQAV